MGKSRQRRRSRSQRAAEGLFEMQDAPDPTQDGQQDSGPGAEQARPGNNLPLQLTSFVGREREMASRELLKIIVS